MKEGLIAEEAALGTPWIEVVAPLASINKPRITSETPFL